MSVRETKAWQACQLFEHVELTPGGKRIAYFGRVSEVPLESKWEWAAWHRNEAGFILIAAGRKESEQEAQETCHRAMAAHEAGQIGRSHGRFWPENID